MSGYNIDDAIYGDEMLGEDDDILGLVEQGYTADDLLGMGYDPEDLLGFGLGDIYRGAKSALKTVGRAALPGLVSGAIGLRPRRRISRPRYHAPRVRIAASPRAPAVYAKPPLMSPAPGVPQNSKLYIPLGLGTFDFTNAAAITTRIFTGQPQKPVRPRRLWIEQAASAGAAGILVSVTDIKVGTRSMLAGVEPIPAGQFAPDAFATSYSLFDSAEPGVFVSVSVSLSALPAVGENIVISMSMDCDSLG